MALLLVGFVGGFLAAISPCVLPVLPVVLLGGATSTGAHRASWLRPLCIVAGLILSFTLFTLFGAVLLHLLGLPAGTLRALGIATLALLGLALLVPRVERLLERPFALIPQVRVGNTGAGSGFALGLALGAVYVPCAGPVLAAIAIAGAGQAFGWPTVALTVGFAAGTAVPLLVIALAGGRARTRARFLAGHARAVRTVAGVAMIALAVALAANLTDVIARRVPDYTKAIGAALPDALVAAPRVGGTGSLHRCQDDAYRGTVTLADCGPAPEFTGITGWLNSAPLSMAGLRGEVVLVDFWAYSCINCQRELPHVQAWYQRYRESGFRVVGVHTPEYAFERETANIAAGAARLGLTFPIAVDNDFGTWTAYENIAWPAGYLVDADGVIRRITFGEGDYRATEGDIRALLATARPGAALPPPTDLPDTTPRDRQRTPELYLGAARARAYAGGELTTGTRNFDAPADPRAGTFTLSGSWTVGDESLTAGDHAVITLAYHAAKVYLNVSGTGTLTVTRGDHTSAIPVSGVPNIYPVVDGAAAGTSTVRIAVTPGLSVYSFTFG
ncbi:protein DipZ [Mycolicibacterium insubricum]|uniref:Thiol:disulfide interchange protein n=1 Tax=Mycolicibacterium insubricum TaxID=444597 RepID=A0A1X0DCK7_9MYCO|nr:cytochrome c biogenesis protein CcdA [Mycolicibacterium insubricum]ORA70121.1 thiol:disulfide interchange protein [Mycolicibacterium insubricum]BBZ68668.1 protein DipZ [Mycolicibacterium insubricum]